MMPCRRSWVLNLPPPCIRVVPIIIDTIHAFFEKQTTTKSITKFIKPTILTTLQVADKNYGCGGLGCSVSRALPLFAAEYLLYSVYSSDRVLRWIPTVFKRFASEIITKIKYPRNFDTMSMEQRKLKTADWESAQISPSSKNENSDQ